MDPAAAETEPREQAERRATARVLREPDTAFLFLLCRAHSTLSAGQKLRHFIVFGPREVSGLRSGLG